MVFYTITYMQIHANKHASFHKNEKMMKRYVHLPACS